MLELLNHATLEVAKQMSLHAFTHLRPAWLMQAGEDTGALPAATRGIREGPAPQDDRYAVPVPQDMQMSFKMHLAMAAARATKALSTDCHT